VKERISKLIAPIALVTIAILGVVLWMTLSGSDDPEEFTLNEFQERLESGEVADVTLLDRDDMLEGELADGTKFTTNFPSEYSDELTDEIRGAEPTVNFESDAQRESVWMSILYSLLPILILVGVFMFVLNMMMDGGGKNPLQFGKAKARKFSKDEPQVTFEDVAGVDEAIEELREIKDFLQEPTRFHAIGAKIPKGVLLFGPPGTGKTLLARAVAGEAGAPFFSISGSDFVEMFVGVGASRVRDLFEQAKAAAPAIIFVDEIDAVGRHRGAGMGGGHDEREQTLNQLLVEMDGFDANTGVILIAATNRPDILDPALLRPGRFDRQILIDRPDLEGRHKILQVHGAGKPLDADVDLRTLAKRTAGFTGAELANLMNESALLAAREGKVTVSDDHVDKSIDRVVAGPEKKGRVMSDHEKRVIAYHESGHALVGHVLQHTDPIHKVSIIARGRALGWTLSLPEKDRYLNSRSELMDRLAMGLGGRAAEDMVFGDITTGAAGDIETATQIARSMVTKYGMSEKLGPQMFGTDREEVFVGKDGTGGAAYSDDVLQLIDAEVKHFIDVADQEARAILAYHRSTLDALAEALLEHETVDEDQLDVIFAGLGTWEGVALGAGVAGAPGVSEGIAGLASGHETITGYRATEPQDPTPPDSTH